MSQDFKIEDNKPSFKYNDFTFTFTIFGRQEIGQILRKVSSELVNVF